MIDIISCVSLLPTTGMGTLYRSFSLSIYSNIYEICHLNEIFFMSQTIRATLSWFPFSEMSGIIMRWTKKKSHSSQIPIFVREPKFYFLSSSLSCRSHLLQLIESSWSATNQRYAVWSQQLDHPQTVVLLLPALATKYCLKTLTVALLLGGVRNVLMRKKEKQEMKTKIFIHFLQNKYSHLMSSLLRAGTIQISKRR